jgi:hypothetical protein
VKEILWTISIPNLPKTAVDVSVQVKSEEAAEEEPKLPNRKKKNR